MTTHKASVGPARPGGSIGILVGQAAFHSTTLLRARQWAQAVAAAAGGPPVAQLGYFSPDPGDGGAFVDAWSRQAADASPSLALLDDKLGGLRGHTLVWLARGGTLDGAPGLALYSVTREPSAADTWLGERELAGLRAVGDDVRTDSGAAPDRAYAALLGATRRSMFDRLVLLACGAAPALDGLAVKLRALVGRPVYFSRRAVTFTADGVPRAMVAGAQGTPWFRGEGARIELATRHDSFFAGTEGRVL